VAECRSNLAQRAKDTMFNEVFRSSHSVGGTPVKIAPDLIVSVRTAYGSVLLYGLCQRFLDKKSDKREVS